jgi:outer membrane usher protein FimD/PapC
MERILSRIMMARVQIYLNKKKSGRIEIIFNSADDLNRLIKVLMDE